MAKKEKKIAGLINLQVPAGGANPAPPLGPALGQQGVNIMEFCKAFNDDTAKMEKGMPIPVKITGYADRSFSYIMKSPPATYLILKAAKLQKGANNPSQEVVGQVTVKQLKEIAEVKKADLNANDVEAAVKILAGSCRSMGIEVVGG